MTNNKIRLQKFLSHQGLCARRKAEDLIRSSCVIVNEKIANVGDLVDPEKDIIKVNNIKIKNKLHNLQSPLVIMLNKPKGYVCSHCDKFNEKTIFDLIPRTFMKHKLMFCGRLDKDTTGLMILSDSGDFVQKLSHPSSNIKKHYNVILSHPLHDNIKQKLLQGVLDKKEFLKLDKLIPIGRGQLKDQAFEVVLSQGKKNEIHRLFEHFGYFVKKLQRIRIGKLLLKGVSIGNCKQLSQKEIELLFR